MEKKNIYNNASTAKFDVKVPELIISLWIGHRCPRQVRIRIYLAGSPRDRWKRRRRRRRWPFFTTHRPRRRCRMVDARGPTVADDGRRQPSAATSSPPAAVVFRPCFHVQTGFRARSTPPSAADAIDTTVVSCPPDNHLVTDRATKTIPFPSSARRYGVAPFDSRVSRQSTRLGEKLPFRKYLLVSKQINVARIFNISDISYSANQVYSLGLPRVLSRRVSFRFHRRPWV